MADVRWKQRFQNFQLALKTMEPITEFAAARSLSEIEKQALIKTFEYTYELAWNVMKDYLEYQGFTDLTGPRSSIREAFKRGLITEGEDWMEMIKIRNLTSHTYDQQTAEKVASNIVSVFYPLFKTLEAKFIAFAKEYRE